MYETPISDAAPRAVGATIIAPFDDLYEEASEEIAPTVLAAPPPAAQPRKIPTWVFGVLGSLVVVGLSLVGLGGGILIVALAFLM